MRDWANRQAEAGCYSWALLSSNDSKTRYICTDFVLASFVARLRYARQGTIGYDPRDVADIVVSPIEDVDEKLVMLLNAFDSEVRSAELKAD